MAELEQLSEAGQRPWEKCTNLRISELVGRCAASTHTCTAAHARTRAHAKPDTLMNEAYSDNGHATHTSNAKSRLFISDLFYTRPSSIKKSAINLFPGARLKYCR